MTGRFYRLSVWFEPCVALRMAYLGYDVIGYAVVV